MKNIVINCMSWNERTLAPAGGEDIIDEYWGYNNKSK